jgi:phosphate-selective porin
MNLKNLSLAVMAMLSIGTAQAQTATTTTATTAKTETPKKQWYENFQIRGYSQIRYNRLFETNENLINESGDRSIGKNGGFFIRRMRWIMQGNVGEHVFIYFQPDLASSVSSSINNIHFAQLRDAYFDVGMDKHNEFRIRIGQSKVPFGFENMQSSQNRLPLDRSDALNSMVSNERDLGAVFMWCPKNIRKQYAGFVADGLKGSGDYGTVAVGFYNGQTANRSEANNNPHVVARATYPFSFAGQTLELSANTFLGKYVVAESSAGTKFAKGKEYNDNRYGATLNLYPKPFGILAEYNVGTGPEYNKYIDSIENQNLHGGFITFSYLRKIGKHTIIPFYRTQYYKGGKKHELDARSYNITENEIGVEWQPMKNFELTAQYTMSSRRFEDGKNKNTNNLQEGSFFRLQAQVNF